MPRLKYRAWAENRAESGSNLNANGSSNDSSTSRCVKELSGLSGELFQSNSIKSRFVTQTPMQCPYNVFTHGGFVCQIFFIDPAEKVGHRAVIRWPRAVKKIL
jgi:hypothetical protein